MSATVHVRLRSIYRARGRQARMRQAALAALQQARPRDDCEWTIRLTGDAELRQLNHAYRGYDRPTDVLSFGGEGYRAEDDGATEYLGDIVISMDRCIAQAAAAGHSADDELALLVVHGTLHLLGYDHDTPARKARMWSAQSRALQSLRIMLPVP